MGNKSGKWKVETGEDLRVLSKLLGMLRSMRRVFVNVAILLLLTWLSSCSSSRPRVEYLTKETTVEVHDTLFRDREVLIRDSIYIRSEATVLRKDSIAPIVDSLNRVIGYDRWHYEKIVENGERSVDRYKAQMDSLRSVVESDERSVENAQVECGMRGAEKLRWWQKVLMLTGGLALTVVLAFASITAYRLFRR